MRFLADEHLSRKLINAIRRLDPSIDFVRVQDVGLLGANDARVLDWAVNENRTLITKDRATIPVLVENLIIAGNPVPPICIIRQDTHLKDLLETVHLIAKYSQHSDWQYPIRWIP